MKWLGCNLAEGWFGGLVWRVGLEGWFEGVSTHISLIQHGKFSQIEYTQQDELFFEKECRRETWGRYRGCSTTGIVIREGLTEAVIDL